MRRRTFLVRASAAAFAACWPAASRGEARLERPPRIHMVLHRLGALADEGFRDALEAAGLQPEITIHNIDNDARRLPEVLEAIRAARPDLIYAQSTIVTQGIAGPRGRGNSEHHITDIPVVFAMVSDPVGAGIVESLDRPGRNVTGAVHVAPLDVQFQAMRSYLDVNTLAVAYNPTEPPQRDMIGRLTDLAAGLGMDLASAGPLDDKGRPDAARIPAMIEDLAGRRPDVLYIPPVNFFAAHSQVLLAEALRHRLPTFCAIEVQVQAGGLMGMVAPFYNVGQLAGFKARQILLDRLPPQAIPVETLSRFSFLVNMRTARALDLYPPVPILRYAQIIGA